MSQTVNMFTRWYAHAQAHVHRDICFTLTLINEPLSISQCGMFIVYVCRRTQIFHYAKILRNSLVSVMHETCAKSLSKQKQGSSCGWDVGWSQKGVSDFITLIQRLIIHVLLSLLQHLTNKKWRNLIASLYVAYCEAFGQHNNYRHVYLLDGSEFPS